MSAEILTLEIFENETAILPNVVAESVFEEGAAYIHFNEIRFYREEKKQICEKLIARLIRIVSVNPKFKKQIYGENGLNWTYTWMRHWLASELISNFKVNSLNIPNDFKGFKN